MTANQIEMELTTAVCAWCNPPGRDSKVGSLSHGICPRHLRKIKFELQGVSLKRHRRLRIEDKDELLLPF